MSKLPVAVLAAAAPFLLAMPARALPDSREIHKTVAAPAGKVSLTTFKGNVRVTGWSRPEVDIVARIEGDEGCGNGADLKTWVAETDVRISGAGGAVEIESDYSRLEPVFMQFPGSTGECTSRPFVHYTLRVPHAAALSIRDHKSDIDVAGLRGRLSLVTHKGTVRVHDLDGSFKLETHKGEAVLDVARLTGDSSARTSKGSVEVRLPRGAGFELDAEAGHRGTIASDFDVPERTAGRGRRSSSRSQGAVNGGGPRLSLETDKGTLTLTRR